MIRQFLKQKFNYYLDAEVFDELDKVIRKSSGAIFAS